MISSAGMQLNLDGLGESFAAALAQGEGVGFLESLLGALPPELEGMSPQELLDWLQNQQPEVLPFAPVQVQMPVETALAAPRRPEDPAALLGLMLSSRGELSQGLAQNSEAPTDLLFTQQAAAEGEALPSFQGLLPTAGSLGAANASRATTAAELPSFSLSTPVTDPGFGEALGERLVWMVRQDIQHAKIHLDPGNLGPLEISMSIKDDVASVLIHAHHATTREVLDGDTQRLRNMLTDSGFTSVDVNVARDGGRQPDGQSGRPSPFAQFIGGEAEAEGEGEVQQGVSLRGRGLVDHYA